MTAPESPRYELLAGLDEAQAARVLALGTARPIAVGADLFRLGDEAESIFLVKKGRLALTLPLSFRGEEKDVLVGEEDRGQTVGWSALVPPHRFTLKARASVDSEVLALPRAALERLFDEDPRIGARVQRNLAAMVGHRLQRSQAVWIRELQRSIDERLGRRSSDGNA